MPVDTFSTTDGNDGGGRLTADTYAPTGGFIPTDDDNTDALRLLKPASPIYWVGNAVFRWDTSTIDDAATVTAAEVDLYVIDRDMDGTGYSLIADNYDFGGEATVAGDITTSDTGNVITPVALLSITLGALNTFTVTDLSVINKTGFTALRFKIDQDSAPTTDNNYVNFATSEHATHPAPLLRVTYSTGESPSYLTLLGVG